MIALSSSSAEDQVAFIPDRYECLEELSEILYSSRGVPVKDVCRFFLGDHPAQNFERGTQNGGHYKCGGCGIRSSMIGDFAHAARLSWRSLGDIQALAVGGSFGRQAKKLKPFDSLKDNQLRRELSDRGQFDVDKCKPELVDDLNKCLKGVQRVPSLLIANPTQPLSNCCLGRYEVLDSEALHDIKGHLSNLFEELPFLVGEFKKDMMGLIETSLQKVKTNCADLRCLVIQCSLFLQSKEAIDWKIKLLISTITEISHILYRRSDERSPKLVLRLYNLTWFHHELCVDLFPITRKITMAKMFGTYFHSLLIHSPHQYEIIAQSSVHTEKQERLFGQARLAATTSSNRTPENIMKSVLLHLQSKSLLKQENSTSDGSSRVSKLAKSCPVYNGTCIPEDFIDSRPTSWQSHLECIAPFLENGGDWWEKGDDKSVQFLDGEIHSSHCQNGPSLLEFRNAQLSTVSARSKAAWKNILEQKVIIPAKEIKIYDEKGNLTSIWKVTGSYIHLQDEGRTCPTTPAFIESDEGLVSSVAQTAKDPTTLAFDLQELSHPTRETANLTLNTGNTFTSSTTVDGEVANDVSSHSVPGKPITGQTIINVSEIQLDTSNMLYKTKLANALGQLLGCSEELREFDRLRSKAKNGCKSKFRLNEHENLLVKFQTETLKKKGSLKEKLVSCEKGGELERQIHKKYSLAIKLL